MFEKFNLYLIFILIRCWIDARSYGKHKQSSDAEMN